MPVKVSLPRGVRDDGRVVAETDPVQVLVQFHKIYKLSGSILARTECNSGFLDKRLVETGDVI